MPRISQKERDQRAADAIATLTDPESYNIQPGETVYTFSTNSAGTMFRLFVIREHRTTGKPYPADITWYAARALKQQPRDHNGQWCIHETVYGMSRSFNIVYNLSYVLFRDLDPDHIREVSPNHGSADPGYLLSQSSI